MSEYPSSIINLGVILSLNARVEAVKTEVLAMRVKNEERQKEGSAHAYPEEHFWGKAEELTSLADQLASI